MKALGDLGTRGVHQRLASQTAFTAALSQELLAVFRTVKASSQHGSQCKYTVKGPHLRRVFCLFKRPCSWLWATGDPSHQSDIRFLFLKLPVRLFEDPPSPSPHVLPGHKDFKLFKDKAEMYFKNDIVILIIFVVLIRISFERLSYHCSSYPTRQLSKDKINSVLAL